MAMRLINPLHFLIDVLLYVIYFLFTMERRQAYLQSLEKGCYAEDVRNGIIKYDPSRKPARNYLTWTEFRQRRQQHVD